MDRNEEITLERRMPRSGEEFYALIASRGSVVRVAPSGEMPDGATAWCHPGDKSWTPIDTVAPDVMPLREFQSGVHFPGGMRGIIDMMWEDIEAPPGVDAFETKGGTQQ